ncbi:MAG: SEC-C domain-containing protein, partial [Eubacterium callanderi]
MSLYEEWKEVSDIDPTEDEKGYKELWNEYLTKETAFYEDILGKKQDIVEGTINELAEKYDVTPVMMAGFMDGISQSLKSGLDNLEELEADTQVRLEIDFEKLYYNMVG